MIESFRARDGREMFFRYWPAEKEERVLEIIHGASEHSGRYEELALWLNERGTSVYALDNRGHGLNSLGLGFVHIASSDWHRLVEDAQDLGRLIEERSGKKPYLLGHSMGSFIARALALEGGDYEAFFFTGTGWQPGLKLKSSLALTRSLIRVHGEEKPEALTERLSFEEYRRTMIKKGYTQSTYGWLISDGGKLEEAIAEEALKEPFSLGAFLVLLKLVEAAQDPRGLDNLKAPVYFMSGSRDVVGDFGRGVDRAYRMFKKAPVEVRKLIYQDMHHEIINERDRLEVYRDLDYFMKY